jgi:hypothetical protein
MDPNLRIRTRVDLLDIQQETTDQKARPTNWTRDEVVRLGLTVAGADVLRRVTAIA